MSAFALDTRLAADTIPVGNLDLSALRLMTDQRFPWTVLIPRRVAVRELFELTRADRALLMDEIAGVSEALARLTGAHKMNVAALGNQVAQLHVHIVARTEDDAAWPNAIWGKGAPEPYPPGKAEAFAAALAKALNLAPNANSL